MLDRLFIQNYALIDQLELEFGNGLNIITGETGAGKSILLGAMALILGQRADSSALLDKTRKCIVEGQFSNGNNKEQILQFFRENELDEENRILIRREISADGKSRSFINDTPVNLQQLKQLGVLLVDIHSQHETLLLNQSAFQLGLVDAFANHDKLLSEYKLIYENYKGLQKNLASLKEAEGKLKSEQDFFTFQFNELQEARLEAGEQEKLEEELNTLTHAEEIKSGIVQIGNEMSGQTDSLNSRFTQISQQLINLGKYNHEVQELASRMKSLQIELKDITDELDSISDSIEANPKRLELVNDRLNTIYRLLQKHRLKRVDELVVVKNELEQKLAGIDSLDEQILALEKEIAKNKEKLINLAKQISSNRLKVIPGIETKIKKLLLDLGMPNAILKIEDEVLAQEEFGPNGIDQIRFLFSANKGVAYSEISKVASGGELSRLMLCLKASIAKLVDLPSIIFDEIDTGVSGEIAFKIGNVMQEMSKNHQLLSITHLPQIASRGEVHFFVFKEVIGKKTFSRVRRLTPDERVVEIARMLSGDKPTAIAMENAKELLKI